MARSSNAKAKPAKNAILLTDVETLTLRGGGAMTSHRRVSAVPQLKCVSHPSLCRLVDLDLMRCTNQGSSYDDADVEWTCSASLPEELRLGTTDVICEGYAGADDPYILKGSCGVEYRVALTPKGERRYPNIEANRSTVDAGSWAGFAFLLLFVGVAAWIIYSAYTNYQDTNQRRPTNRRAPRRGGNGGGGGGGPGGGGGGGGWDPRYGGNGDDNDDPPPPYPGSKPSSSRQQSSSSWRPGFWTGVAGAGAAGYAAGRMGGNSNNRRDDYDNRNSAWGRPRGSSSYSSSSQAGPSGTSHDSTGFGSTSRR